MNQNDKVIITAFIYALTRLDKKLPTTVLNQLGMIQDVADHARRLEMVASSYTDLARLYEEEYDRLLVDASDRRKGYLPTFDSSEYDRDLEKLAECICHSPNPVQAAKDAVNSSKNCRINQFFQHIFNPSHAN
ncbi:MULTISPECIES: hypothetical protein [Planktothricoides]|uniref:Uncharacterized protein n=2 Tax=Planktothricoides raciborskii TaxID=132608 RepID=A0AAU8JGD8_9CYAN|nr:MULTISPECIES: hypothetical protein [Planktothricoides]KOR36975.1 hypothetical protein AM228_09235 [Planktothricoides sp. SR001]MBD2545320.1 hypothetical protein [Planktothricoides raciborskii FACHB-1370]MBD2584386.1 hypothetical protein [Planktothricoides raciborskii FACHB-1261]